MSQSWSDNDSVAALSTLSSALDGLSEVAADRVASAADATPSVDDSIPLQNLPAHLMFARHWEKHRHEFLRRLETRNCPLCGSEGRSPWFDTQDGYRYDICDSCTMVYIPQVLPLPIWDEYYASLPEARAYLKEQMINSVAAPAWDRDSTRFGRYFSAMQKYGAAGPGARLLDLGSFTGSALRVAGSHGFQSFGIEGLAEAVEFAHDRFPSLNLTHARTEQLEPGIYGGEFDIVTMWETLEHTLDPVRSLKAAARVLRPGGMIAISVPNVRNVQFSVLGQFCFYAYGGYQGTGHINMFSPDTLTRALKAAGFELRHLSTEFGTDWRQLLHYLRQEFDRIHCYSNLVRSGNLRDAGAGHLSVVLNWLSPALTKLEHSCDAGPIMLAIAQSSGS